jgi:chromosome segregation ATPase
MLADEKQKYSSLESVLKEYVSNLKLKEAAIESLKQQLSESMLKIESSNSELRLLDDSVRVMR